MSLQIEDNTFYLVQLPEEKTLHESEDAAINHLKENAENLDPENDEVSLIEVSVEGEDWTIAEMPWQNIALRLMGDK
ncbi:hypothetical protein G9464_12440 [Halostella sp. JP-L12]|uniref:hypothetical protein n=1 Tax=Halostella TaxID=1843185 RepID=UPI000EF79A07|nr:MULTISPECIES: hypothetical protein [Halostella]NHN48396.1 hypothetical protein [Halostella sp. JP-L12]